MAQRVTFFCSVVYFCKVSPWAPPCQVSHDCPPDIDHSTRWFVHSTELSRLQISQQKLSVSYFVISIAYFVKVSPWTPPWHRSQHKMNCSQHSTFYNENILSNMVQWIRLVISIAYFVKVSPLAPPWQLSHDCPPDIDHSKRWFAHSTALSTMTQYWQWWSRGTRFMIWIAYFFKATGLQLEDIIRSKYCSGKNST